MVRTRLFLGICLMSFVVYLKPTLAQVNPVIIKGKVTMPDGSPPPFQVGLERYCSALQGLAGGPITNKQGEYLWRMDLDPMDTRFCSIRATYSGYISSSIDLSSALALKGYVDKTIILDPIIITYVADDPYVIRSFLPDMPARVTSKWEAAVRALSVQNTQEAMRQLRAVVETAPNFAVGWHALGVLLERHDNLKDAREAYENAVKADSKFLPVHVTLIRLCIKTKDWEIAATAAEALIKVDKKHHWPEAHLHRAVALYALKDLEGADASVREAIRLDPKYGNPRTEYVMGRILEAKGDLAGAREHISKYLELDKKAPDVLRIREYLEKLGDPKAQTDAASLDLENL
jgi:tetratricopeptide (TPR) repeat protein